MITPEEIRSGLLKDGFFVIPEIGILQLLPRRKGKTFVGFRNVEGTPRYSKRVKFTSDRKLRNDICK